jgi:hypothetical protein
LAAIWHALPLVLPDRCGHAWRRKGGKRKNLQRRQKKTYHQPNRTLRSRNIFPCPPYRRARFCTFHQSFGATAHATLQPASAEMIGRGKSARLGPIRQPALQPTQSTLAAALHRHFLWGEEGVARLADANVEASDASRLPPAEGKSSWMRKLLLLASL